MAVVGIHGASRPALRYKRIERVSAGMRDAKITCKEGGWNIHGNEGKQELIPGHVIMQNNVQP